MTSDHRDDGYSEFRARMTADSDQYMAACRNTGVLNATASFNRILDEYAEILEQAGMDHEQILGTVTGMVATRLAILYAGRWGA